MAHMIFMSQVSMLLMGPQGVGLTEMVNRMYLHIFDLRELEAQVLPLRLRQNLKDPEAEEDTAHRLLHCALLKLFLDKFDLI